MTAVSAYTPLVTLSEKQQTISYQEIYPEQRSDPTFANPNVQEAIRPQLGRATQRALLLKAAREQYTLVTDHAIPSISNKDEILVKIVAIGLNPIDWKGPAFNFGIPSLPWVNGRDLAGVVVKADKSSRVQEGDIVLVPSTDYRDIRKAAFQEYAIATHFNAARIPPTQSIHASASLGVAFVASALALGVSLGLDFSHASACPGPDLTEVVRRLDTDTIPVDIREECYSGLSKIEQVKPGDWIAIWGASTTTGYITLQLAKLAGLKVICVADIARHGARLVDLGADALVDRHDTQRAVDIIKGLTKGKLRYAIDIVGKDTATLLQQTLDDTIHEDGSHAHLLGLTGLPKDRSPNIIYHTVPIKLFHTSPQVGERMVSWLEDLLHSGALQLPEIIRTEGGLDNVNASLELLRQGTASGKRIVVDLAG
ncbi:putative oxidoreductase, zinc-binding dehydrogenase family [Aspergillus nomiae NRRL 13137]|uniref:Putative oxidoreductase, zinc-binding dehydrogenase family n=1 Tax=Aspergillus nomiae NRRL (strain ATCC 15546 / NRRL 13137 / CBS 260.88 / M93) TaxID=1509407 RepID=A0A0L1J5V2_ASPN3|nr:putative oxidoreductase, zinc-binding dehydrogenase family [Aspergillus nomiae NRRL 13137]KNG87201.1 putative oxidoreductase, zinc-binding dehydrogenase family [Aspergillus nomiae NRRL 13137]